MNKLQNNNIATPPQVPPQVKSHLYTEVGSIIGYDGGYAYLQIWKSRFPNLACAQKSNDRNNYLCCNIKWE